MRPAGLRARGRLGAREFPRELPESSGRVAEGFGRVLSRKNGFFGDFYRSALPEIAGDQF